MSKLTPKFRTKVVNGELHITNGIKAYLHTLPEDVELSVKPYRENRSNPQNKYYHSVVVNVLSEEIGYTKEEMHEILKALFLSERKVIKCKDEIKEVVVYKSTTELKTTEFEEYLSDIRQWASMYLGIFLPTPNQVDYE